jgi:hypothetical protein
MQIDMTTLTQLQYQKLLDALFRLNAMKKPELRKKVVERLPLNIQVEIDRHNDIRLDVMAIWDTCSSRNAITELRSAIELLEGSSPAFQLFQEMVDDLERFVKETDAYYARYEQLAATIRSNAADAKASVARWFHHTQALLLGSPDIGPANQSIRDLLLVLSDFNAASDGSSFPLFVFVEGILSDLFTGQTLTEAQAILDSIAKERGVKEPGIARLRKAVQDLRNPVPSGSGNISAEVPLEPALLVVIEPHDDRTGAPPYRLHFYRWEPWETEELMRVTGTAGRGICVRDPSPYIELEHLKGELSTALGALLREIQPERQCVEFVVPGRLLCEPFEHIKVDLWGDVLGLTLDPEELGVVARVVVRSWERTHTKFPPQLCEQWRRRWRHVRPPVLRACQLDPSSDAFALLQLNENREVSFLWVAFAPVCPVASQKILGGLLKGGVPISLWRREEWCGTDANAVGEALAKLVDTLEPADLRDRVQDLRVQAVNAAACPHIGKSLTLFWDDPNRVPPQAKSVPSPLR